MKWKDSSLTLGERCVAFAEHEMFNNFGESSKNSYTSPRIKEYFAICTRLINKKETHINFTAGNWCAAGASFCLHESILSGETLPHGYRLGVVEIIADMQRNGFYRNIDQVRHGIHQIKIGDLVFFDRSVPNKPNTFWWRHIGRVYSIEHDGFKCISGNNGGKWRISDHKFSQTNLLGFGEYPSESTQKQSPDPSITDTSKINDLDLAPAEDTGDNLSVGNFFEIYDSVFGQNK